MRIWLICFKQTLGQKKILKTLWWHEVKMLRDHFWEILLKRNCEINFINAEIQVLKSFMAPLIKDNKQLPSLTFGDEGLPTKKLYENVKMCYKYSKYYLSCPLQMLNWKGNWLTGDSDWFLWIDKGESFKIFSPELAIDIWVKDKIQRLTASLHRSSKTKH